MFVGGNKNIYPLALAVQRMMFVIMYQPDRLALGFPNFPVVFAGAAMMSIPPILAYVLAQQYFMTGLVGVGIKG